MSTASEAYLIELRNQLRARGVVPNDAEEIVREAESHLAQSGGDPVEDLGSAEEFASAIVSRGSEPPGADRDGWEHRTITGATAFNEMRMLAEAGCDGWQLVGCAPFQLQVRRPLSGGPRWEYRRAVGGPVNDSRLTGEGWHLATTWMIFRYYRRPVSA